MKRRFREFQGDLYYLSLFRGEYLRIRWHYLVQVTGRWRKLKALILILIVAVAVVGVILWLYRFSWTGFSAYFSPTGAFQREKTLWDWLQLLVIPAFLAGLAYWLSAEQKKRELAVAGANKREQALHDYLDYMTHILLDQDLTNESRFEGAARLARARTLTVLEMVDGRQKGHILRFLIEAQLIDKSNPIVQMDKANLQGVELDPGAYHNVRLRDVLLDRAVLRQCSFCDAEMASISLQFAQLEYADFVGATLDYILLTGSNLYRANLHNAQMIKGHLRDVNLESADLRGVVLRSADMRGANLRKANLTGAYLPNADLAFANLSGADLSGADLSYVNFIDANLKDADLTGAILVRSNISLRQLTSAKSIKGVKIKERNALMRSLDFPKRKLANRGVAATAKGKDRIVDQRG